MKFELLPRKKWQGRFLAALVFEDAKQIPGFSPAEARAFLAVAADEDFRGQYKKTILLRSEQGNQRLLLAGLGKRKQFEPDRLRVAVAKLVRRAEESRVSELGLLVPGPKSVPGRIESWLAAVVQGAALAAYRYTEHKQVKPEDPKSPETMALLFETTRPVPAVLRRAVAEAELIADAVCYARDLVNEPPSQKTPGMIAELATWLAKRNRITVEVLRKKDLVRLGMNGILRVGAGSHEPPCLIHLTYKPKGRPKKTACVVGKGITFDSGGLCLKPATSMDTMKCDMAGAAAVLGLFRILAKLDLPVAVHGIVPLAENLPGGAAQKPGDVIRAYGGKTIEVLNTDAEGRLILADALAYGSQLKPDVMVDMATLTGACVIALGDEYSALLGTDRRAIAQFAKLGQDQGEFFWELPLPERYRSHIESKVADVRNIGKPKTAGTIIGGLFLQEFVDKAVSWVHIDIAGSAYTTTDWDYAPAGGTGVPLRTLFAFLRGL